jgi:putative phosphoesterase
MEIIESEADPYVIGVVSDTHIPDRVCDLHPRLLEELSSYGVQLILHAGDVSVRSVISRLEEVAPVRAVLGNRDVLLVREFPMTQEMMINGTILALTHGHMGARTYWSDKFAYLTSGYRFKRYQQRLNAAFPDARIIVFGHTHHAENCWVDGKLYFNPGSASRGDYLDSQMKFGTIKIYKSGKIESDIVLLSGAVIQANEWVKSP